MAFAAKRRVVVNAGRRRRRTNSRRKLTAKQIKFFGTPAQKAALKKNRFRKRNASARSTMRRAHKQFGQRLHRRRTRAKNPGDILSLTLNPGKVRKEMAASKRHRRRARLNTRRRRSNPRRRYAMRHAHRNPARRRYSRRNAHRRNRRNPSSSRGMTLKNGVMFTVGAAVGYFGSKSLTQVVMGTSNTGMSGYLGNALVTAGLAVAAHMFRGVLGPSAGIAVLSGGLLQLIARVLSDQTTFGQLTSSLGVGDYQVQNFVTPQRLVDPLNSAQIEIPNGWGAPPPVAIQTAAVPGAPAPGMHGWNNMGLGRGLYSSQGLYS